ncbi:hypothetical protein RRG08_020862 [Elysia crispata]|uniref:Uncharacterized protein n=1 Tax=Elysia crispata TaxID=231223 RepID=A0AAE1CN52_9GAST|nr:hypothetical protein RRG08_020862 [Elysia crispata]
MSCREPGADTRCFPIQQAGRDGAFSSVVYRFCKDIVWTLESVVRASTRDRPVSREDNRLRPNTGGEYVASPYEHHRDQSQLAD